MITRVNVYGLEEAILASGLPMTTDSYPKYSEKRATSLGSAASGSGHDSYLKGIVVQFNWKTPVLMQPQIQRYHFIDIISSQSAMHRIAHRDEFGYKDFSDWIKPSVMRTLNEILNNYKGMKELGVADKDNEFWRELIVNLPQSYLKEARYTTNYLQLKTMYMQRRHHKLEEWQEFCDWCLTLPKFKELTGIKGER